MPVMERQPGFAYVEIVGADRYSENEPIKVTLSRVPCIGEMVRVWDDDPQRVRNVIHSAHYGAPGPNEIDAVIYLEPLQPQQGRATGVSARLF
ncbi:hypothetical protein [Longimicrobium sp.]|uniref:hypothetical protein n=1 Tax=Longimicrobium sp. TaxID=2029185 RepID=UPI002EDBA58D